MELYKVLAHLVENPLVPRFYREMRDCYLREGKVNEAQAFDHLIEHKFGKNDDSVDNPLVDTEQPGNNSSNFGVDPAIER